MLSEFFDKATLKLLDYVLEFNEPFGIEEISNISHKNGAELLQKFAEMEIITCINPDVPAEQRKYKENQKSNIFACAMNLDLEISNALIKLRKQKIKSVNIARQAPAKKKDEKEA